MSFQPSTSLLSTSLLSPALFITISLRLLLQLICLCLHQIHPSLDLSHLSSYPSLSRSPSFLGLSFHHHFPPLPHTLLQPSYIFLLIHLGGLAYLLSFFPFRNRNLPQPHIRLFLYPHAYMYVFLPSSRPSS